MPDKRIAPSAHLRQALSEFLTQGIEQEESPTSALLGLAARVVLQEALEVEQRDALGRERRRWRGRVPSTIPRYTQPRRGGWQQRSGPESFAVKLSLR